MGIDRGSRGGGGQNGYRRDNHPNGQRAGWGREADSRYNDDWSSANGRDGHYGRDAPDSKYDKYDQELRNGRRVEENGHTVGGGRNGGTHNGHGAEVEMLPQALVQSLEERISSTQATMTQELNASTGKENEKFDLIFGILIELQRRQAQLEESVRSLRTQGGMGVGQSQPAQGQPQQSLNGQQSQTQFGGGQNFVPQGNQINGQMNGQGGSQGQMGNPTNGQMFMPNQMNMGQQYGNMVAADGSQAYFTNTQNVVLVAQPMGMAPPQGAVAVGQGPQGQAMQPFAMPQMISGPMQPQMAMQFVGQDQAGGNYQWSGSDNSQQDSAKTEGQMGAINAAEASSEVSPEGFSTLPQPEQDEEKPKGQIAADDGNQAELRIEEE